MICTECGREVELEYLSEARTIEVAKGVDLYVLEGDFVLRGPHSEYPTDAGPLPIETCSIM